MADEAIPEALEDPPTGPFHISHIRRGRVFSWVRAVFAGLLAVSLVTHLVTYSLYQTVHSKVDQQERRLERLDKMVTDLLVVPENTAKLEAIGTKLNGIEGQVQEMTSVLKESDAKAPASPSAPKTTKTSKPKKNGS